ncbi:DNA repair exonuclease SbcCD nuclease subunit [Anaerosolibacter carboniphilus]|uniref:DNA repair exonuclease SbcCD nuclease subunit n=1 Tax=Anaerosolibacter carboniphilus TaxID=1417629 RepID=A0A841KJP0_9FIRM|nr:DNA repair exonuclease [Anaerosolibacter carboniphilus]MBB6214084.1 DNA repair exonuclease SbcCD nuclease subunit [Anaerosolibacter carboniphilus]
MEKVKLLHCADFHFDTPFRELAGVEAEKRKEDLRETFGRVVQMVKEEQVDVLLISGDFFDNDRVMKTSLDHIMKKFEEISNVRVFISPGNHDPYTYKSYYHLVQWPKNVHIFDSNLKGIVIPELNLCVYGVGFSKSHEKQSLIQGFQVEDKNMLNIMVLHGEVVSEGQGSDYNPITEKMISDSGLDYLALGHKHGFSGIMRAGETFWAYSGNPEGRGFDEVGSKGILLGTLEKSRCDLVYREICKRKYMVVKVDIEGLDTYEEISEKIKEQIIDSERTQNLYKIILTGEVKEGFTIHPEVLREKLFSTFHNVKIVDETTLALDYEGLANEFSLRGIFIRNMMERLSQTQDEETKKRIKNALKLGIQALGTGEVNIE